jgi:16S rRNA (cytosine967-C5)-methyltransferase
MTPAARVSAAIEIVDNWLGGKSLEAALLAWSRRSRFAGSKDRSAIRDLVFDAARRKRSYAALGGSETGRGILLGALRASDTDVASIFNGSRYAPDPVLSGEAGRPPSPGAEACDMPDWLWRRLEADLGQGAETTAMALRDRAPVFLRVNLRSSGVEDAKESLEKENIEVRAVAGVPTALEVTSGARYLRQCRAYLDGRVELQDAASQDVVADLPLKDGMRVLDFCAGGGGKSLAMAALWDLDLTLHDTAPERMQDAVRRGQRAGIEFRCTDEADLADVEPFDLVLCDAPCSGSGTWRRAPDAKWRLTPERLTELNHVQVSVLQQAKPHVKRGGYLVYVTCSILASENQNLISDFLNQNSDVQPLASRTWPVGSAGDGFFSQFMQVE